VKVHDALAEAFRVEGVKAIFGLMGDGNMDFLGSVLEQGVISVYDARHEGSALAMADGYARASGEVGVCTVTHGPGVTQLGSSLTVAARHGTPLVVLAGDLAAASKGIGARQDLDQRRFAEATGALYRDLRARGTVADDVQQAFWLARVRRLPVLLNCPVDLQESELPGGFEYQPSTSRIGRRPLLTPDDDAIEAAADLLAQARRPVIIAGEGAMLAVAREAIEAIGERVGAAFATTIRAKGYLDGPWSVGICGNIGSAKAEAVLSRADLVVFVGTSANTNVTAGGGLFSNARTVQIDTDPTSTVGGHPADCLVVGDARLALEAILHLLTEADYRAPGIRSGADEEAFKADALALELEEADWDLAPGEVDPRRLVGEFDRALPLDCTIVVGVGHFFTTPAVYLNGHRSRRFLFTYDFGCIGQAVPTAFGVAVADPSRPLVVFEGDVSALMHVHEFDTMARYAPRMLVVVLNDGGLGAEFHKLRAKGKNPSWSAIRPPDFGRLAEAFGVSGSTLDGPGQAAPLVERFLYDQGPHVVDARISRSVVARYYRKSFFGEGGPPALITTVGP
jgi:thiamine pyrophosphate-dependent acetolactate synthase large subunit-like protein